MTGCLTVWLTCRLWYNRGLSGGEKAVRQLHYLHVIPARLETHPRAFNPKFQTLDATLDTLNEQLSSGETVINGRSSMLLAVLYCICLVLCTFISCEQWLCWISNSLTSLIVYSRIETKVTDIQNDSHLPASAWRLLPTVVVWHINKCRAMDLHSAGWCSFTVCQSLDIELVAQRYCI